MAVVYSLAASGAAFGIALAVVEWRDDTADLRPIDERLSQLEAQLQPLDRRTATLEEDLQAVRSDLQQLLTPEGAFRPAPSPPPTPTASLTVNAVQRITEFRAIGSDKPWTVVNVTIENTSAGDVSISYSGSQFAAIDSGGFRYPATFPGGPDSCRGQPGREGAITVLNPPLSGGTLRPGEKARGEMAFDLPEGTVLVSLIWSSGLPDTPEISADLQPPRVIC